MEVEDAPRPGLEVEHVDVLRHHSGEVAGPFKVDEGPVRGVGARGVHVLPPEVVACPIVAPEVRGSEEHLNGHRGPRR
ncbi:hypothetical protein nbrc107697_15550 [Gordonia crocea]|uniref:Uncharacterized protein n=1 Tax=Gordonia crocea TaxID=589162 RepID=A0A7I9UXA5_9ACTN|nr:hypothetical protein nbrc107697_15550 [Gordonia crocea]